MANDDTIEAYGTYTGMYKIKGKPFVAWVANISQLKDGKIISIEKFVDS